MTALKIVIELVRDNPRMGEPFSREDGLTLLGMMSTGTGSLEEHGGPGEYLELCDFDGKAVLCRVVGVVDDKFDGLVPYIAPPVEA